MQTKVVEKLPTCSECISEERSEPKDATFVCQTPTKIKVALCDEHFMNYVESRLGTNTVQQLALVQKAGRNRAA